MLKLKNFNAGFKVSRKLLKKKQDRLTTKRFNSKIEAELTSICENKHLTATFLELNF